MLPPFLQPKKTASIIMQKKMKAGGEVEANDDMGEIDPNLVMAAEDVLSAIAMKDANALASALYAAFEVCDAGPHEEGEHLEEKEND